MGIEHPNQPAVVCWVEASMSEKVRMSGTSILKSLHSLSIIILPRCHSFPIICDGKQSGLGRVLQADTWLQEGKLQGADISIGYVSLSSTGVLYDHIERLIVNIY